MEHNTENLPSKIITTLFLSGDPVSIKTLCELLEVNENDIRSVLGEVKQKLNASSLDLIDQNNQLTITTQSEYADIAVHLREYELSSELTPAQLQTLTIVAYMGPINNANVSFIRGVQSSQTLRSLATRGLITKSDTNYNVSIDSMKYLGISNISDLPSYDETREKLNAKISEALNG
jgi:segregation and condensation protein B